MNRNWQKCTAVREESRTEAMTGFLTGSLRGVTEALCPAAVYPLTVALSPSAAGEMSVRSVPTLFTVVTVPASAQRLKCQGPAVSAEHSEGIVSAECQDTEQTAARLTCAGP